MVFCILSDTTYPMRVLRRPRGFSVRGVCFGPFSPEAALAGAALEAALVSVFSAITIPHRRVRKPDPTHVRAALCTHAQFPDAPYEADGCWRADRSPSGSA